MTQASSPCNPILRMRVVDAPGCLDRVASAVRSAEGSLALTDFVRVDDGRSMVEITILAGDDDHLDRVVAAVRALDGVEVELGAPSQPPVGEISRPRGAGSRRRFRLIPHAHLTMARLQEQLAAVCERFGDLEGADLHRVRALSHWRDAAGRDRSAGRDPEARPEQGAK